MAPRGFEDEELTISLSSSHIRRQQQAQQTQQQHAGHSEAHDTRDFATDPRHDKHAVDSGTSRRPHNASGSMDAPKERTKVEQRIGAYKIVRTLGEGSFGKVRLAIHNVTGQQVALKFIARKRLISRDMAGRVEREIEYLQLLRHPHIIKLYDTRPSQPDKPDSQVNGLAY